MAFEKLDDASIVRQGDMVFRTAVVFAAVGVTAVVERSVVSVGVGIIVVYSGRNTFRFVCPLVDGPVGMAIVAQSRIASLLLHIFCIICGWNNLGATLGMAK